MSLPRFDFLSTLLSLGHRYSEYLSTEICRDISEHDDMFVAGGLDHYLSVGRSAIDIVARAMVTAGKKGVSSVLDMPCGGGRVTRHLTTFLPDATLYVGDLDKGKEAFVVAKFGATALNFEPDFSVASSHRFDLIFVGSLITHFAAKQCARAARWFIDALAPDGLLVVTTHGRRTLHLCSPIFQCAEWRDDLRSYADLGFGYRPDSPAMPMDGPLSYGLNLSAPSWVTRLVENDPEARILSFQEAVWDNHHDVLVVQKRPIVVG